MFIYATTDAFGVTLKDSYSRYGSEASDPEKDRERIVGVEKCPD